jgi:hypothetical protein
MSVLKTKLQAILAEKESKLIPANIRAGVTIFDVVGNLAPDKPDQSKTATPTTSQQVITADTGYELAQVTIAGVTSSIDSNIAAGNIKSGVTILGVEGTVVEENPEHADYDDCVDLALEILGEDSNNDNS